MLNVLITLFNPDHKSIENINAIARQADRTILCDNSPQILTEQFEEGLNIVYRFNDANLGLSRAFNKVLKDDSFGWTDQDYIFFFDQDTVIPDGHLKKMVRVFEKARQENINLGCLGPSYYNTSSGTQESGQGGEKLMPHLRKVNALITSSMLTEYRVLRDVGFWNEDLFLDLCDWDLSWRVMDKGYVCAMTDVCVVRHSIGKGEVKAGVIKAKEGAPFREYYQTSDCLKLIGKGYTPLVYKLRFMAQVTVRPVLHLALLPDKKERLRYIKKGFSDYRAGYNGVLK